MCVCKRQNMCSNIINIICEVLPKKVLVPLSVELSNVSLEPCKKFCQLESLANKILLSQHRDFHIPIFQLFRTYIRPNTNRHLRWEPVNHFCASIVNLVHLSALMYWVSLLIKVNSWVIVLVKIVISSSSFMLPEHNRLSSETEYREKVVTGISKTSFVDSDSAINIYWEADQ